MEEKEMQKQEELRKKGERKNEVRINAYFISLINVYLSLDQARSQKLSKHEIKVLFYIMHAHVFYSIEATSSKRKAASIQALSSNGKHCI